MPGVADGLKITALQSLQEISTSDHKPVCAIMELKPAYGFSYVGSPPISVFVYGQRSSGSTFTCPSLRYNAIIPSGWTIQVSGLSCRNLLAAVCHVALFFFALYEIHSMSSFFILFALLFRM